MLPSLFRQLFPTAGWLITAFTFSAHAADCMITLDALPATACHGAVLFDTAKDQLVIDLSHTYFNAPDKDVLILSGNTGSTTAGVLLDGHDSEQHLQNIILDNAVIDSYGLPVRATHAALAIRHTRTEIILTLRGHNSLRSSFAFAGLEYENSNGGKLVLRSDNESEGTLRSAGGNDGAGIGGSRRQASGRILIRSGTITAHGGMNASGIGGGSHGDATVSISGGNIKASGGHAGSGIGSGACQPDKHCNSTIIINGGHISASGHGGGSGIGGGQAGDATVTITGGTIIAQGGRVAQRRQGGSGIGGGAFGHARVIIDGGSIYARRGSDGADGIGCGSSEDGRLTTCSADITSSAHLTVHEIPWSVEAPPGGTLTYDMLPQTLSLNGIVYSLAGYGLKDIFITDYTTLPLSRFPSLTQGIILWLPVQEATTEAEAADKPAL